MIGGWLVGNLALSSEAAKAKGDAAYAMHKADQRLLMGNFGSKPLCSVVGTGHTAYQLTLLKIPSLPKTPGIPTQRANRPP